MPQFVGDVFGLSSVYEKQVSNVENKNFTSWPESATYGYYGGGAPPPTNISTITRLDFFNETISDPGNNLPTIRSSLTTVSSSSCGYFGGGYYPSPHYSTITRLNFSSETTSNPGNNLPTARSFLAGTSNNSYGYFGGGREVLPTFYSTITRLDFSNETVSDPGNNLPKERFSLAAVSSSSYGYFVGGYHSSDGELSVITRLDFSSETVSDPGKNLLTTRSRSIATSSNSYGYFAGGFTPFVTSIITRLDFSNETISDPGKNLPTKIIDASATSSNFYGYFAGGYSGPPIINTIQRLDFSNETLSLPGNNLPTIRSNSAAVSGGASTYRGNGFKTYGYLFGGDRFLVSPPPQKVSTILRMDFSTEGYSDPGKNMPTIADSIQLVGSKEKAYGKWNNTQIIRFDYTNETNSLFTTPSTPTSSGKEGTASNSNYGYWLNLTRIDFSSETLSSPIAQSDTFTSGRSALITASASNLKYAYFAGGGNSSPNVHSSTHRLDFSNEVITEIASKLNNANYNHTGISSQLYGYFGGGVNASSLDKIDFFTELVKNVGALPTFAANRGGVSSNFYGYFSGGYSPSINLFSTVSRIEFSNDTISNTTSLPIARDSHTGVSNSISSS